MRRGWVVYGVRDGFHGILSPEEYPEGGFIPLTYDRIRGITHLGGTILGTSNHNNPLRYPIIHPDGMKEGVDRSDEIVRGFGLHHIDPLITVGGDGSLAIASVLAKKGLRLISAAGNESHFSIVHLRLPQLPTWFCGVYPDSVIQRSTVVPIRRRGLLRPTTLATLLVPDGVRDLITRSARVTRLLLAALIVSTLALEIHAQEAGAPGSAIVAAATPIAQIKALKGFQVELLYSVPKGEQGSWVNMCVGPKGTLVVSDQGGPLYRIHPPSIGTDALARVEKIPVDIGEAQGLLWAFDSLYVVTNGRKYANGLYRVTDTNGDGELDKVEQLRTFQGGGGEHGPHAVGKCGSSLPDRGGEKRLPAGAGRPRS